MITVVLNAYQRPELLERQIHAIQTQSIQPKQIMLWANGPLRSSATALPEDMITAHSSKNLGVWARFYFAMNATTDYVAVFDDDTIPGKDWFANCLDTMWKHEALLGTIGIRMKPNGRFGEHDRYGWSNGYTNDTQNVEPVQVDYVGHAWFLKRAWLSDFARELPDPRYRLCGEDMHFSYALQRYAGIPTFVPPHPPNQPNLWGSTYGHSLGKGGIWDANPVVEGTPARTLMKEFFNEQRAKGWRLIYDPVLL